MVCRFFPYHRKDWPNSEPTSQRRGTASELPGVPLAELDTPDRIEHSSTFDNLTSTHSRSEVVWLTRGMIRHFNGEESFVDFSDTGMKGEGESGSKL